jgi:hypothetical protein
MYVPSPAFLNLRPTSLVVATSIVLHSSINLSSFFFAAMTPFFSSRYTAWTSWPPGTILISTFAFSAASRAVATISMQPKELYSALKCSQAAALMSFM